MIIKNRQAVQNLISTNNINMNVADVLTNAFMYVDAINPDEVKQYVEEYSEFSFEKVLVNSEKDVKK